MGHWIKADGTGKVTVTEEFRYCGASISFPISEREANFLALLDELQAAREKKASEAHVDELISNTRGPL